MLNLRSTIKEQRSKIFNLRFFNLSFVLWILFVIGVLPSAIHSNVYALNIDKVKVAFVSGDYKKAITEGERVMATSQKTQNSEELYYYLALSYLKDGNYLRASDIFEILINEFKGSVFESEAKLGLGDIDYLRDDYESALKKYKNLLQDKDMDKVRFLVYSRLIQCSKKVGNVKSADDYKEKFKSEFPLNPEPQLIEELKEESKVFHTVQVGSFSNSLNANKLAQEIKTKGFNPYIEESYSGLVTAYKVKVGKLQSKKEAQNLETKLKELGYPTKIWP